ncbi:HAD family hydrolase, partial [Streptomyces atratus]|uniref:HAD family hydrolase n=1 Tax=Streptomyces atratus TaxID=1893 RepID=UPI0034049A46
MEIAWLEVQKTHGLDMPFASYERHLGREFSDIMHRLGVGDAELVHETYEAASRAASHLAQQFAGIAEVLHALVAAEWRLGVVTSKPLDRAAPLLAQLGCPFATVRTPSSLGRAKPAPDPILLALIDLGVDPSASIRLRPDGRIRSGGLPWFVLSVWTWGLRMRCGGVGLHGPEGW